jgi:hypothetical protein
VLSLSFDDTISLKILNATGKLNKMDKIAVTNDPTLYLRNSGLRAPGFNSMNATFTMGVNREHSRPIHSAYYPAKQKKSQ